ncbi:MAG: hypothetical protein K6E52_02800 [Bacteroidaceae bacterium]|nr:hypothetical protein [Bacteroidaceae bacterium]
MKEIKLYHKVCVIVPWLLIMLGLTIVFLIPITKGLNQRFWIWNWGMLLFSGAVFLWGLSVIIRERVLHIPPIIITDDKLIVGKKEYNFADIHHFDLIYFSQTTNIRIHYKPDVEAKKKSEAKGMDRIGRKINRIIMGAEDCIQVANLTMKPEKLCNLLNKRVKQRLVSQQP